MGLDIDAIKHFGDEVIAKGDEWCNVITKGPLTLVHGDSHCENYLYKENSEDENVVMIDFQLTQISQPLFDVANFLVLSMATEDFDNHYEELVGFYYNELSSN
jgi:thiamine kinase-like enzyme